MVKDRALSGTIPLGAIVLKAGVDELEGCRRLGGGRGADLITLRPSDPTRASTGDEEIEPASSLREEHWLGGVLARKEGGDDGSRRDRANGTGRSGPVRAGEDRVRVHLFSSGSSRSRLSGQQTRLGEGKRGRSSVFLRLVGRGSIAVREVIAEAE